LDDAKYTFINKILHTIIIIFLLGGYPNMPRKKSSSKKKVKEKKVRSKSTAAILKKIDRAIISLKLYPVAVSDPQKKDAMKKIFRIYEKSNDSVRQHILMIMYEHISEVNELRNLRNIQYYKAKNPKATPGAIRMNVYKDMFNYNTSLDGLVELVHLLGHLEGRGPAKLLTHLFTHFCSSEVEISRVLRNAAIEALGKSSSSYALKALLRYTEYSDNEKILARLGSALMEWGEKIDELTISEEDKHRLKHKLQESLMREEVSSKQYG
jgi:hypothetical protein